MKAEYLEHGGVRLTPETFDERLLLGNMRVNGMVYAGSSSDGAIEVLDLKRFGYGNKQLILNEEMQATVASALGMLLGISATQTIGVPSYLVTSILDQLTRKDESSTALRLSGGASPVPRMTRPTPTQTTKELSLEKAEEVGKEYDSEEMAILSMLRWLYHHGYAIIKKTKTETETPDESQTPDGSESTSGQNPLYG